jgi:hypothetical protein
MKLKRARLARIYSERNVPLSQDGITSPLEVATLQDGRCFRRQWKRAKFLRRCCKVACIEVCGSAAGKSIAAKGKFKLDARICQVMRGGKLQEIRHVDPFAR